jgi:hypothetical protein
LSMAEIGRRFGVCTSGVFKPVRMCASREKKCMFSAAAVEAPTHAGIPTLPGGPAGAETIAASGAATTAHVVPIGAVTIAVALAAAVTCRTAPVTTTHGGAPFEQSPPCDP